MTKCNHMKQVLFTYNKCKTNRISKKCAIYTSNKERAIVQIKQFTSLFNTIFFKDKSMEN